MSECDGEEQGENGPKEAGSSCCFAHHTSGVNLYPPDVWFADVISLSCVMFVLFRFRLSSFTRAAAFRSIVVRFSICMRSIAPTATRSWLPNNCLRHFSFLFLPFFVSLEMWLFPSIFVPLPFSLIGEYVICFSLPDGVFLPCDHGLDFWERKGSIRQRPSM